tara:strand:+ start:22576 stop:22812 length:237 start_codon:yes stop_codon:yes gene_type:complete
MFGVRERTLANCSHDDLPAKTASSDPAPAAMTANGTVAAAAAGGIERVVTRTRLRAAVRRGMLWIHKVRLRRCLCDIA